MNKNRFFLVIQLSVILLICMISFFDIRYWSSPPLHSDDWSIVAENLGKDPQLLDLTNRRPLISVPYYVLTFLFGLNLRFFYIANVLVLFLTGIILLKLSKIILADQAMMAILVSILALVYPIDFTKTWLIHIHARTVLLIDLLVILLMILFARNGELWRILLANILFLVSLGIYEAGLGVVLLADLLLIIRLYEKSKTKIMGLASILLTGFLFVVWRLLLQPRFFMVQDNYLDQISFSLPVLGLRYAQALFIAIYNWAGPLINSLGEIKYLAFSAFFLLSLLVFAFLAFRRSQKFREQTTFTWQDRKKAVKYYALLLLTGGMFWAAGYIPTISYSAPAFFGDDSRFSLFSTMGAALALVALLAMIVSWFAKSSNQIKPLVTLVTIPLILTAMGFQIWSNNARYHAWEVQKTFWNEMIQRFPGLKDGTRVGIIITGETEKDPFEIANFSGNWEARSALRVLYNNPSLNAFYYFVDRPLDANNQIPEIADWSQYLFIAFDEATSNVEIIDNAKHVFLAPFQITGYDPTSRITVVREESLMYRSVISVVK